MAPRHRLTARIAGALVLWLAWSSPAHAQRIESPPRIGPREFIHDEADLMSPSDEAKIKKVCDKVLTDKKVPIIVVTIDSMAKYGARGWDIRVYGQHLFNTWQIGFEEWNQGMLLLVSKQDRKVAIELGAGWKREKDAECKRIIDKLIVPKFKEGSFSAGILAGVKALGRMARELKAPERRDEKQGEGPQSETTAGPRLEGGGKDPGPTRPGPHTREKR